MNLKCNKIIITTASNCIAFVLLTISFLGMSISETLAQGTNTTNTTNTTAANAGEVSPITVIMPAGSAAATGGGDMNQIQ